jgi:hypothetical protein
MSAPGPSFLVPDWPAPPGVHALMTLRGGGTSSGPHASFNLGAHCGDAPEAVRRNRALLRARLPAEPRWVRQVHGVGVVQADALDAVPQADGSHAEADASYTRAPGTVCAILVADCMPILLCTRSGDVVAAAHAGWRGLAGGVIEATVTALGVPGHELMAWLGPAIGPQAFQVGPEVRAAFVDRAPEDASGFRRDAGDRWLCDLTALARARLTRLGVSEVYGGGACTVSEPDRFFSYRRDRTCGRMAALVWRSPGDRQA